MQAAGGAGPKRLFDLSREGERRLQRSTPRAPGPRAGTASRRSIRDAPGYAVPAAGVVRGLFSRATRALHAPAQRPNTQPVQHGKIIQGQVAAQPLPDDPSSDALLECQVAPGAQPDLRNCRGAHSPHRGFTAPAWGATCPPILPTGEKAFFAGAVCAE